MALTRFLVQKVLYGRCQGKMWYANIFGYDNSNPPDHINTALDDPIAEGLRSLGIYPDDPTAVGNSDLLNVAAPDQAQLFDISELRLLENVLGNLADPDQTAGEEAMQYHGKLYSALEVTVARKQAEAKAKYGYGVRPLSAGTYDLGFTTSYPRWGEGCR